MEDAKQRVFLFGIFQIRKLIPAVLGDLATFFLSGSGAVRRKPQKNIAITFYHEK